MQDKRHRTGHRWITLITEEIWTKWHELWAQRNHDLHGFDESTRSKAERLEVERSLRDIYDLRAHMEPSVQQLLCKEVTDHYTQSIWFNKNWLSIHAPLVRLSVRRAKERALRGVRSIRQYFAPA